MYQPDRSSETLSSARNEGRVDLLCNGLTSYMCLVNRKNLSSSRQYRTDKERGKYTASGKPASNPRTRTIRE
jgi:hypothetical protein